MNAETVLIQVFMEEFWVCVVVTELQYITLMIVLLRSFPEYATNKPWIHAQIFIYGLLVTCFKHPMIKSLHLMIFIIIKEMSKGQQSIKDTDESISTTSRLI